MSTIETPTRIPAGTWTADPKHSAVEARIKHMGIATVTGHFPEVEATLEGGAEPRLRGTIHVTSIDSQDADRDAHLRSPDFFDAERYPEATFESTSVEPGRIAGELTLKGVTRPVEFAAEVTGAGTDPWGNERIGVDLDGEIDRTDFGVNWNAPLPGGGFLLADRVRLHASLSLTKAA
jgi:polyisoprenoid-binding protein YceI